MRRVRGVAQHYAWGDTAAIPALLGVPADGRPWAEWWVGTHPGGPATLDDGTPLRSVAGELPYLLKLLAADTPLSLQTHPDTATAQAGFARENAAGVDLADARRIYRDPFAKPEVLCALTPFDALCGFRPEPDTAALLRTMGLERLATHLEQRGLEATVAGLYRRDIDAAPVVAACAGHPSLHAALVTRLDAMCPDDPSVAVTLFLHRVLLQPGEAIYLTPGNLHAYVHGFGVEVMGASDNVVRGGLTPKHVDVDELLRVLRFEPLHDPVVQPRQVADGEWSYDTPDAPFAVTRLDVRSDHLHTARTRELVLCTAGRLPDVATDECAFLAPGESMPLGASATVWIVAETSDEVSVASSGFEV